MRIARTLLVLALLTLFSKVAAADVAIPTFAPSGSISPTYIYIQINCSTPNAIIRYTTDGSDPSSNSPAINSGASVLVGRNLTLKAKAWLGTDSSAICANSYTIPGGISLGGSQVLALKSDASTIWAWGLNNYGQLGDGTLTQRSIPICTQLPANLPGIIAVAAGSSHSLALTGSGNVIAWGLNSSGQLGNGTTANQTTPVFTLTGSGSYLNGVSAISAGSAHSVAVKISGTTGTAWAWGWNQYGQLGDGTITQRTTPVQVKTSTTTFVSNAVAVDAGFNHCLALTSSNTVLAWGNNAYGQLGDGTQGNRYYAYELPGLSNIVEVSAGANHSIAVKADGSVWAWGYNVQGELGIGGTNSPQTHPVQVLQSGSIPFSGAIAVSAGEYHSLILKSDGTVWACGYNRYGQLGDGSSGYYDMQTYPVQVQISSSAYLTNVVAISAGNEFSAALCSDGSIYTWGNDDNGQNGLNNSIGLVYATTSWTYLPGLANHAPTVTLSLSAGPYVEPASIIMTAVPSDLDDTAGSTTVTRVDFFQGSTWLGSSNQSPYTFSLSNLTAGNMTLSAVATDIMGATGTAQAQISVAPPPTTVSLQATVNSVTETSGSSGIFTFTRQGPTSGPLTVFYSVNGTASQGSDYLQLSGSVTIPQGASSADVLVTPIVDRFVEGDETVVVSLAEGAGYSAGSTSSDTVTIVDCPPVAKPVFQLTPGYYLHAQDVPVICTTPGAILHYTLDGRDPSETDPVLTSGSVTIPGSAILRVKGFLPGFPASDTASGAYTMGVIAVAGDNHVLASSTDGNVWSWGYNSSGQLGLGDAVSRSVPTLIGKFDDVIAISANTEVSFAISGTAVWAWGYNVYGELGTASGSDNRKPSQVIGFDSSTGVSSISAGYYFTAAVDRDSTVWTWGRNTSGQLGNGTTVTRVNTPARVQLSGSNFDHVIAVSCGTSHTLALKDDGTVWAWGDNSYGELGDGTIVSKAYPIQAIGLSDFVAISAGPVISMALKADGTIWTWGDNSTWGRLGCVPADPTVPNQVPNVSNVVGISSADRHMLALTTSGTVLSWGDNRYGELGDGTTTSRTIPGPGPFLPGTTNVGAGYLFSVATQAINGVTVFRTWGNNASGQLGNSGTAQSNSADAAHFPADSDEDGMPDWQEALNGTDPSDFYNGVAPTISKIAGDGQNGVPSTFLAKPLQVQILDSNGIPLVNAPVYFQVAQGGGLIAAGTDSETSDSLSIFTDSDGYASVYYQEPDGQGVSSQITASAGLAEAQVFTANLSPLIGFWKFEEGSGSVALDSSNTGNDAALYGGSSWTTRFNDGALSLDGSSSYAEVANNQTLSVGSGPVTISAWVTLSGSVSLANDTDNYDILYKGDPTGTGAFFEFAIAGGINNGLVFRTGDGTSTFVLAASSDQTAVLGDGNWHHVAFVRDELGGGTLFLDGIAVGTLANLAMNPDSSGNLWIGRNPSGPNFNGSVDEVELRTDALSPDEIFQRVDSDSNGLPDGWEWQHFGHLGVDPNADPDQDGLTNLQEYQSGTDPNEFFNGVAPTLKYISGDGQNGLPNAFLANPLVAQVIDGNGNPLPNAPVTFQTTQAGGCLATGTTALSGSSSQSMCADANGYVSIYYNQPALPGVSSQVTLTAGGADPLVFNATTLPMIGLWQFEEGTGGIAYDSSNLGNNAVLYGGYSWVTRFNDGALALDGSTGYCEISDSPSVKVGSGPMTFGAWVKLGTGLSLANDTDNYDILYKGDPAGTGAFFEFAIAGGTNNGLVFRCSDGVNTAVLPAASSQASLLSDGGWHHVAFARDQSGTGTLYLDGTVVGSQGNMGLNIDSSGALWFGRNIAGPNFAGNLDEVQLSTQALSVIQIAALVDTNHDGLPDGWEWKNFGKLEVDPNADPDQDGLNNLQEFQIGTNPNAWSTLNDGIPDGWKVKNCLNPLDPTLANADPDQDGLTNLQEYVSGTDPWDYYNGGASSSSEGTGNPGAVISKTIVLLSGTVHDLTSLPNGETERIAGSIGALACVRVTVPPGSSLTVTMYDGGLLNEGAGTNTLQADNNGIAFFYYNLGGTQGMYRVSINCEGEIRVINFWSGDLLTSDGVGTNQN